MGKKCLICGSNLEVVLDLGKQPRANAFVDYVYRTVPVTYDYHLALGFCVECSLTQTIERPAKHVMFNENYAYHTSINQPMVKHFSDAAKKFLVKLDCSFVLEIGSNDGAFLQNFVDNEFVKHLGIEPSLNVLDEAQKKGIECWGTFFDVNVANDIVNSKGKPTTIYAANVMGHVENIGNVLDGVALALDGDGTFVFEIYYLPSMLSKNSFDLIYDEHIFYFTLNSLNALFKKHGLRLYDFDSINVHGGSIRGYVTHASSKRDASMELTIAMDREVEKGFLTIEPLKVFSSNVERTKQDLKMLVSELKTKGKTVYGYGATAKSTTILNYCDIDIDAIVDSTPCKQGKYSPGKLVPIVPEEQFRIDVPDVTILFAWNYAQQIMDKQRWYSEQGGRWVLMHPNVRFV